MMTSNRCSIASLVLSLLCSAAFASTAGAQSRPPSGVTCHPSTGSGPDGRAYCDFQVDKPVTARPESRGPVYPEMLRSAGIEGMVLMQFVVDTTGRIAPTTIKVLKSDNDLFTAAVRTAMDSMTFVPAEVGKRKVRQLVQMPFQFSLNR